jgi:hypothetical protein
MAAVSGAQGIGFVIGPGKCVRNLLCVLACRVSCVLRIADCVLRGVAWCCELMVRGQCCGWTPMTAIQCVLGMAR